MTAGQNERARSGIQAARPGRLAIKRVILCVLAVSAAFAGLLSVSPGRPAVAATTVTFAADADAYVRSTQATTNFGTSTQLQSCAPGCGSSQGEILSFLHFTVSGLSGSPTSVQLSLFS